MDTIAPPGLAIAVEDAAVQEFAAVPTLRFTLALRGEGEIRSVMLRAQIRVAAPRRSYDTATRERLADLFGAPHQWSTTLRSLLWTHTHLSVPEFSGETRADLLVGCTYDFDAGIVTYFRALAEGDIPLEFLFSGTIFYSGPDGALQAAMIPWDTEAEFRLPVTAWDQLIDAYYPGTAWLRLRRDTAERLSAYRTWHMLATVDDAVASLLDGGLDGGPR
ncbi:hypothetical protein DPM19_07955 [Actinomadura craniellae]|uniref:Uncharacterized protein n=1 Tax=Actinomadura craniellae TaxID=2231787 RepID=A0A365H9E8_9ACTN|nr:DUF6084 family protein [Actinomadura craniellae]RAY15707.1 hypothetical protein DPM19_07955 [Actinomadura craniellae]